MYFYVLYYGIFLAVGILGFVFPFLMSTVVCFRVRLLFEIILWFVISFLLSVICIKSNFDYVSSLIPYLLRVFHLDSIIV
jgi:hypothetical protein